MRKSNFMQNQNHSPRHHQTPFCPGFAFTSAELYPHRRRTEYYYEASIPEEYQSRNYEHPSGLDHTDHNQFDRVKKNRIFPPQNSEMRVFRDSYFS